MQCIALGCFTMHALNTYFHVATAKRNFRMTKCSLFCISYYIMWFLGLLCCNNTDLHTKYSLNYSSYTVYTEESIMKQVWAKNPLRCINSLFLNMYVPQVNYFLFLIISIGFLFCFREWIMIYIQYIY